MRSLTTQTAPENFIGAYGPDWREGLLTEHLDLFVRAGGVFRPGMAGVGWAVVDGGRAVPVVCSEAVAIFTEDGEISGRCGEPARKETGVCDGHGWRD